MEAAPVYYDRLEFIVTETGNKISRKAVIHGSKHIVLGGKSIIEAGAILHGDGQRTANVSIALGRWCHIASGAVLKPPTKLQQGSSVVYPMRCGDCVTIGAGAQVSAASIGHCVTIGADAVIGRFAVIKEGAYITEGSHVPPYAVVPPLVVVDGQPALQVDTLPAVHIDMVEYQSRQRYARFLSKV